MCFKNCHRYTLKYQKFVGSVTKIINETYICRQLTYNPYPNQQIVQKILDEIESERNKPVQDVEIDGGACVANVAEIVGSDAAHVHAHAPRHVRIEDLLLLCHRVVNPKSLFLRHSSISLSLFVSVSVFVCLQRNSIKP